MENKLLNIIMLISFLALLLPKIVKLNNFFLYSFSNSMNFDSRELTKEKELSSRKGIAFYDLFYLILPS